MTAKAHAKKYCPVCDTETKEAKYGSSTFYDCGFCKSTWFPSEALDWPGQQDGEPKPPSHPKTASPGA